jgi:hypothetical protein
MLIAAATDEVNDLQAVAGGDRCLLPASTPDDLAVPFDGDAVALQIHLRNNLRKRCRRRQVLEAAALTVDDERKRHVD